MPVVTFSSAAAARSSPSIAAIFFAAMGRDLILEDEYGLSSNRICQASE